MQSSGKIARSAPWAAAWSIQAATLAALPSMSPTVGLIWARAMRKGSSRVKCRFAWVRGISKLLGVTLAAASVLLGAAPGVAAAADPWVFRAPSAPPTDKPDPNRHTYTEKQAPQSPSCTPHFCVHWVARGADAPSLLDADGI